MIDKSFSCAKGVKSESGQVMLFVLLGLGLFMIGAMAFAIDLSNLWFNRQAAQTAADAACTAGAMDLLVDATNGTTTQGHFGNSTTAAVNFDCNATTPNTATTNPAPCVYAALNGFPSSVSQANATGGTLGDNVFVDFPGTVPGITAPPTTVAPTAFMRVTVINNTPTFFANLLGRSKQAISAIAVCGVAQSAAPIPILVLDPNTPNSTPAQAALNIQGNGTIAIFGGPSRSIQANSAASTGSCGQSNCTLNLPWGSAQVDLSHGGPLGTGSDIGVTGAPTAPPSGFVPGSTGHWIAPAAPIMDPFAQTCYPGQTTNCNTTINGFAAPTVPAGPPGGAVPSDVAALGVGCNSFVPVSGKGIQNGSCNVPYKFHGCPDTGGCVLYLAGPYPSGIGVGPGGGGVTAIFDPGLYYVTGGLALNSGSEVRNGSGIGDGSGGVTFYFSGTGTVSVAANSGSRTLDPFNTLNGPVTTSGTQYPAPVGGSSLAMGVKCISSSVVPNNLQGGGAGVGLNGNVLLGPCSGYYGDPLGASEPASIGEQRWFLFFQDRSAKGVQPSWGGGGQFLLAGTMYFHSCNSSGSGVSCTPPPVPATNSSYYQDIFSLSGNSGAGTYVLGDIVADNLTLGGTSGINMDLNPTNAFNILKASLYQ
jgi:hypothetical protein